MKQYQFPHPAIVPVSDGDIFIFSFAMYIPKVTLQLLLADNHATHSVRVDADAILVEGAWPKERPKVPEDANVVIRVDKISPNSFITYLNGDLIATTNAYRGHGVYRVGVFHAGSVQLAIFDSVDRKAAEVFAEAMRNPAPNDVEPLEREKEVADREKEAAYREKEAADREMEAGRREREVADREKRVAGREREVAGREKLALEKEKALEAREKALERCGNDMNSRDADGKDEDEARLFSGSGHAGETL